MAFRFVKLTDIEREWLARAQEASKSAHSGLIAVVGEANVRAWVAMRRRGLVGFNTGPFELGSKDAVPHLTGYIMPRGTLQLRTIDEATRRKAEGDHQRIMSTDG